MDKFKNLVHILARLSKESKLYVAIVPPYFVRLVIDQDHYDSVLRETELKREEFERLLNQIAAMILASLSEREDEFITHEMEAHQGMEANDENEELLKEKLLFVKENLISQHLAKRYLLKKSSKAPAFAELDWDIKLKSDDAKQNEFEAEWFPYTTLKIKFQRDFSDSPFAIFSGSTFDSVQINLTIDEVEYLKRELNKVENRLRTREEGLKGDR